MDELYDPSKDSSWLETKGETLRKKTEKKGGRRLVLPPIPPVSSPGGVFVTIRAMLRAWGIIALANPVVAIGILGILGMAMLLLCCCCYRACTSPATLLTEELGALSPLLSSEKRFKRASSIRSLDSDRTHYRNMI